MNNLHVITAEQCEQWNSIVRSFSEYDIYYLSGYVKAFQLHGDGEPLLFYYESDGLRGINVVMKRDIADDPRFTDYLSRKEYYDFSTPYGYGGWLLEGEGASDILFEEFTLWCKKNAIVSEFVRFHPLLSNHIRAKRVYDIRQCGQTVYIDLTNPKAMWNSFSSQNRNKIRKAQNKGVKVFWGRSVELLKEFEKIYQATMNWDGAQPYYYFGTDFYKSILYDMANNAMIFYASYEDRIIAAAIILYQNKKLHYHFSGFLREYASCAATNLLLYQIASWGAENGFVSFHLGGGVGSREDSLFVFKKGFNKNGIVDYFVGSRVLDPEKYEFLNEIRAKTGNDNRTDAFFPAYRG